MPYPRSKQKASEGMNKNLSDRCVPMGKTMLLKMEIVITKYKIEKEMILDLFQLNTVSPNSTIKLINEIRTHGSENVMTSMDLG